MKVDVMRSTGLQRYEVPRLDETMTVMDVLDYIYEHLDHSLAYYRHSSCNQAICGKCLVKLNGEPVLACAKRVEPTLEQFMLSPADGTVIRDLVITR